MIKPSERSGATSLDATASLGPGHHDVALPFITDSDLNLNTTMTHLPNEILDIIIDFLHDDQDALQTCSLVCKSWLPSTRFHRFRNKSKNKKGQSPILWATGFGLEDLAKTLLGRDYVDVALWKEGWFIRSVLQPGTAMKPSCNFFSLNRAFL